VKVGDRVQEKGSNGGPGTVISIRDHPTAQVVIDVQFDNGRVSTFFQYDDLLPPSIARVSVTFPDGTYADWDITKDQADEVHFGLRMVLGPPSFFHKD
jgi:hypothetical protein